MTVNLCEDQYTLWITSCSVLLITKNVSDKRCIEHENTTLVFGNFLLKIMPFVRECGKILWSQADHQ
jgi:hypothetical protein